jgi:haloacetate dehalogenase
MFAGFIAERLRVNGVELFVRHNLAVEKPPLLLLHGYPQSHVIWHKVAPALAERFSVVVADLRGYGASSKPVTDAEHLPYSKRAMAADMHGLMQALGFARFGVVGHDRGGRVAHRLALDFPAAVNRAMFLDIAPTLAMYEQTSMAFAAKYWWWFFLIQPAPFPETMISAAPEAYLKKKIGYGSAGLAPFTDVAYGAYLAGIRDPATVHAMCEDYRAAASIDLIHDREDRTRGHRLACAVHALWGETGVIQQCFQPLAEWRLVTAEDQPVTGYALPGGHYIPEELPERLVDEICRFWDDATGKL